MGFNSFSQSLGISICQYLLIKCINVLNWINRKERKRWKSQYEHFLILKQADKLKIFYFAVMLLLVLRMSLSIMYYLLRSNIGIKEQNELYSTMIWTGKNEKETQNNSHMKVRHDFLAKKNESKKKISLYKYDSWK